MFLSLFRAGADDRSPYGNFWFEPVGTRTLSGVHVSPESAMRLTAVYACVRRLASTMACLPFVLYRNRADGGKQKVADHWLYQLMARRPNRYQNAYEWRQMMQGHLALRGNAYNEIIAGPDGSVRELVPLHPDKVQIELMPNGSYRYKYAQPQGQMVTLGREQVLHLRGLSSDGIKGYSPIELAAETLGFAMSARTFATRFMQNDATPPLWIEYPREFKDKAAKDAFREMWHDEQTGAKKGKTAVMWGGMKLHEVGLSNKDSQFFELAQLTVSDIARIFGVQPHMIGDLSKATNNNIEQQSLEFVMYTMTDWAELWEHAIEGTFLDDGDDLEVEFDFQNLLRGDSAARSQYYNNGINGGWLTRNEARIMENLDPIDGLSEPTLPMNVGSGNGGDGKTPAKPPAKADPEPEPEPTDDSEEDARAIARLIAHGGMLLRAVADRAVVREVEQLRKLLRADAPDGSFVSFYEQHVGYLRKRLLCDGVTAANWCAERADEFGGSGDRATTLREWDRAGGAELAAIILQGVANA